MASPSSSVRILSDKHAYLGTSPHYIHDSDLGILYWLLLLQLKQHWALSTVKLTMAWWPRLLHVFRVTCTWRNHDHLTMYDLDLDTGHMWSCMTLNVAAHKLGPHLALPWSWQRIPLTLATYDMDPDHVWPWPWPRAALTLATYDLYPDHVWPLSRPRVTLFSLHSINSIPSTFGLENNMG